MYAIVKTSIALGKVVYEGGAHWAAAYPGAKPMTFEYRTDADAMARGLGDGSKVVDLRKAPLTYETA